MKISTKKIVLKLLSVALMIAVKILDGCQES